ncbi:MAG: hypothetical protein ABIG11_00040 [bacterium]
MKKNGYVGLIACLMLAAAVSRTNGEGFGGLNFDQGLNISDVVQNVKVETPKIAEPGISAEAHTSAPLALVQGKNGESYVAYDKAELQVRPGSYTPGSGSSSIDYTGQCERLTYHSGEAQNSPPIRLRGTQEVISGQLDSSWTDTTKIWNKTASVSVKSRELLPWETETINVCLNGPKLSLYQTKPAYQYQPKAHGSWGRVVFELIPIKKIPMDPDPAGLAFESLVYDKPAGNFRMTVTDKWADYYNGDKTVISVELRKDVSNWPDKTMMTRDIYFDPAGRYEINFAEFAPIFSERLKPGQNYFVKWGFKRIGRVSKDSLVDKGATSRVSPY